MAIVARGLGQPESGAIVTAGLGATEADPNAITATLTGTGAITGTLTAAGAPSLDEPDFGPLLVWPRKAKQTTPPRRRPAQIAAVLSGPTATVSASLTFTTDYDAELLDLLLVGAI